MYLTMPSSGPRRSLLVARHLDDMAPERAPVGCAALAAYRAEEAPKPVEDELNG